MTLTPEQYQTITVELTQERAEAFEAAIDETLDTGWLYFEQADEKQRRFGYMNSTLTEDFPLIMTEDYAVLRQQQPPIVPPLHCEIELQQLVAAGQQITDWQRYFWALLLVTPKVFTRFQRDFIRLLKETAE